LVRLVIIDLTNGLLTDDTLTAARHGAQDALQALSRQYRLVAFVDEAATGVALRDLLEGSGLSSYFKTVITSADAGDALSAAMVRRIAGTTGTPLRETAVICSLPDVAETLQMAGILTLLAEPERPLSTLPEALAWVAAVSSG
jgi:hypothetical protein